jgi:hypothetical protein
VEVSAPTVVLTQSTTSLYSSQQPTQSGGACFPPGHENECAAVTYQAAPFVLSLFMCVRKNDDQEVPPSPTNHG